MYEYSILILNLYITYGMTKNNNLVAKIIKYIYETKNIEEKCLQFLLHEISEDVPNRTIPYCFF